MRTSRIALGRPLSREFPRRPGKGRSVSKGSDRKIRGRKCLLSSCEFPESFRESSTEGNGWADVSFLPLVLLRHVPLLDDEARFCCQGVRQERCSDRQVYCHSQSIQGMARTKPSSTTVSYQVFTLTHSPFSLPAPIAHSSDRARAVARGRTRAHDPISALDSDVMSGRPCISAHHLLLPITIMCTLRLWLANAHHLNMITTPEMRLCADRYRSPHKLGDDAAGQSPGSNYSLHRFVRAPAPPPTLHVPQHV